MTSCCLIIRLLRIVFTLVRHIEHNNQVRIRQLIETRIGAAAFAMKTNTIFDVKQNFHTSPCYIILLLDS